MALFKAVFILLVLCILIIQANTAAVDANDTQTKADVATGLANSDHHFGRPPKLPRKPSKPGRHFFHMPRLLPPCPKHCKCPPPPPPPPCPKKCKCPPPPPPKKKPNPPPPCPKHCKCPPPPPPPCPKQCKCPPPLPPKKKPKPPPPCPKQCRCPIPPPPPPKCPKCNCGPPTP